MKENDNREEHSRIGASGCNRWWNCPGQVQLCKDLSSTTSIHATTGIAAHTLCEIGLKRGMGAVERMEGDILFEGEFEIEVDDEMIESVRLYVETILSDLDELRLDRDYLEIEKKFVLDHIDKDAFGRNDACISEPFGILRVYDFKYGHRLVEVKHNYQLMYYAVGAAKGKDFSEIEFIVVQPRAKHKDGYVRRWRCSPEYLADFEKALKEKIEETKKPNAVLNTGPWCKYCPAADNAKCLEMLKSINEIAKTDFEKVNPPHPNKLNVYDIIRVLNAKDMIKSFLDGVEQRAFELIQNGQEVSGFKVVEKRTRRKWIDEKSVINEFEDIYGNDIYAPQKLKSPAQLEKIIGKKEIAEFTETPLGGLTLVPVSDKREPVKVIKAENDFNMIEK
jgi:hypothetical protein